jgi:hypothetical protein
VLFHCRTSLMISSSADRVRQVSFLVTAIPPSCRCNSDFMQKTALELVEVECFVERIKI